MIKKKEFFLTDIIKEKLKHSKVFITEVDMNIPLKKQIEIAKQIYMPDNKTLRDYVSEEDYKAFSAIMMDSLGISKSKFEKYIRIKPYFSFSLLIEQLVGKTKSYERELYKIAKNQGLRTGGLETFEFQMSLIDDTPIDEQAAELINEAKNYKESIAIYDEMVQIYKQQDIEKLYYLVVNDSTSDSEFNYEFIYERNITWIPLIQNSIRDDSCFIAVGSAHLPGENGIIALLRNKGYTVLAIK